MLKWNKNKQAKKQRSICYLEGNGDLELYPCNLHMWLWKLEPSLCRWMWSIACWEDIIGLYPTVVRGIWVNRFHSPYPILKHLWCPFGWCRCAGMGWGMCLIVFIGGCHWVWIENWMGNLSSTILSMRGVGRPSCVIQNTKCSVTMLWNIVQCSCCVL